MLEKEETKGGKAKGSRPTKSSGTKTAASKPAASRRPKDNMHDRIQRRAYELWEREGRPEGREHAHWQQAEMEITRARTRPSA